MQTHHDKSVVLHCDALQTACIVSVTCLLTAARLTVHRTFLQNNTTTSQLRQILPTVILVKNFKITCNQKLLGSLLAYSTHGTKRTMKTVEQ